MAYLGIDPKAAYSSYRNIDNISASFDGLVTTFPLRVAGVAPTILPINEQQVLINVGGVPQQPDPSGVNGFKLLAGNIVFSSAPSAGETFWGVILASANYISANTRFADGSAGLPSVTFASDVTTGLYSPGAGQLAISTGGTGELFVNTSGIQVPGDVQANSYNGGPLAGLRNAIINGGMQVAQRGAPTITAAPQYGKADRFIAFVSGGTSISGTVDQSADTNFQSQYRLWLASLTYTTGTWAVQQRIEAINSSFLNNKTITVSFKVFHDFGSPRSVVVSIAKANAIDNFGSVTAIGSVYTSPALTSATYTVVSCSFTLGATDATNGLLLQINDASATTVSAKNVLIGDVQLEAGTIATPFERRPIGQELALCQRYYEIGTGNIGSYSGSGGIGFYYILPFKSTKRAAPTLGYSVNSITNVSVYDFRDSTTDSGLWYCTATAAGGLVWKGAWSASAEL